MWKILGFLQKHLIYSIPASMIAGVMTGYFFEVSFLRVMILPLTFLMIYPMMVNLQIRKIFSGGDAKLQLATFLINFGVIPFLAYGTGLIFFTHEPKMALGLLMIGLIPASGMTISWTGFGKGNLDAAIKMTVIGLVSGALLTPLYAEWLMGAVIDIPMTEIFQRILLIVFLPMLAGFLTQRYLIWNYGREKFRSEISRKFPLLSSLGVLGVVFVAMALRAGVIIAEPLMLLYILLPLLVFYGIIFSISTLIGKHFFPKADGIALVYGSVLRNLSVALAVALAVFGPEGADIVLVISLAYIIQVQAAAWYMRFLGRIF